MSRSMAITEAERLRQLAVVRRLEAAGFRAWPATSTAFDGTWAVRLTRSFPGKRLNSVNPLDPSDNSDIPARIVRARRTFAEYGRSIIVRQSPLAPPELVAYLDGEGWPAFDESLVMTASLAELDLAGTVDRIPIRDVARYVASSLRVHDRPASLRAGLTEILQSIRPPTGLFIRENAAGEAVAVALAIYDNDLAGLLDVAVIDGERRRGTGKDLVRTALRYTAHKGAKTAWVQVEADNAAGLALYGALGFKEAYRYVYRAPPGEMR
ncbi:N-acetyltransferase [Aurantimonas sp. VKM B-3413]|uniref:GNAT family N-acetyltransferase n=1 Tax=Aurantimonas sp. VKM B-3413 TaxID=2779401 RepID=UPI001E4128DC|nr:GNAT family N-acetyltransferase [Aurantimonas sp. VKM B-3413]MCB8837341.1 GNAT family N-acetyltransferase [Aurantimonas sp. VKM B-3413]